MNVIFMRQTQQLYMRNLYISEVSNFRGKAVLLEVWKDVFKCLD